MPYADAVAASDAFRASLLARERASAVRLVRAYGGVYQRLQTQLAALTAELDALAAKGEQLKPWKVGKMARLQNLQTQVAEEVTRYGAVVENEIDQGAKAAIAQAQTDAMALTQAALPGLAPMDAAIMSQWQQLNPGAVESMFGFLDSGSPLRLGLRTKYGPLVAAAVGRQLVESISLGYNPRKTAAALKNSLGMGLESALRTSRTAQLYAYRESTRAAYAANVDIVPKWKWRSARDGRTCASCLAMDGTLHDHTESLNDHWNGRCAMVPVPVTYRDLGLDIAEPPVVLAEPTGEDWFRAQPEANQKAVLGPGKYAAWQKGEFPFAQLSRETTDPVWGKMRGETPLKDLVTQQPNATAAA
jgi:hypothetical protein